MDPGRLFEVPNPEGRPEVSGNGGGITRAALAGVERLIDQRLSAIPGEISDIVGARLRSALEGARDRTTGGLEGVRSSVVAAEQRLTAHVEALSRAVESLPARVRESAQEATADLRSDLEVVRALPRQIARVLEVVREVVGSVAESQEALGSRVTAMEEGLRDARDEIAGVLPGLDQRMERVDELAGAVESLGKRRGFKELVQSEREAVAQQEAYVRQLVELGEELGSRLKSLQGAATARSDAAAELERIRTQLAATLEDLRDRLAAELASGFVGVRSAAWKGGGEGGDLLEETRATRAELERIRARIEAWGSARTAPRLAEEVSGLGGRVAELESVVQHDLTDAVFGRMQQHLDRRFEALVRLIESRVSALVGPEDEEQRRRFRRR